jgi:hypothetical protein
MTNVPVETAAREDGEEAKTSIGESNSLLRTASGTSGVIYYRGPMSVERVNEIKSYYLAKGWGFDAESVLLSFVSPCGRWFDCFDTSNSNYYRIDGDWVVNLKVTRKRDEDGIV